MININSLLKKINIYKFIFYTLIYKYLFGYILFIIFFIGCYYNKIDLCCGHNTKFWDIITCVFCYNLWIISIFTFINFILILLNIYIEKQNYKNNEEVKYLNEIKKINNIEIKLISLSFISFLLFYFTPILIFLNLGFYINILIILFLCGISPISILEILFYFEKKKTKLSPGP